MNGNQRPVREFIFTGEKIGARDLAEALIEMNSIKNVILIGSENSCDAVGIVSGRPRNVFFYLKALYDSKKDETVVHLIDGDISIPGNIVENVKDYIHERFC